MGSREVFPVVTEAFPNGATPSRVMQVARIIPALLERRWPGIRPSVVDGHPRVGRDVISHDAWLLHRQDTHLPNAYEPTAQFSSHTIISSSLYIHGSGRLDACTLVSGQSSDELILDDGIMRYYDNARASGHELYTLRDTASVARAITFFAHQYDIINEDLIKFSSTDPRPVTG